jgi:erythrocyte band 7 integral membrane protein
MASSVDADTLPAHPENSRKPLVSSLNGGGHHTPRDQLINVQPPRREDLQPSYAKVLSGDGDGAAGEYDHGWYGSMSRSHRASSEMCPIRC